MRDFYLCHNPFGKMPPGRVAYIYHPDNPLLTEHNIVTERSSKLCEIKHLYVLGTPIRSIAGIVKMSRNTVRKYIHLDEPPSKNGPGSEILIC